LLSYQCMPAVALIAVSSAVSIAASVAMTRAVGARGSQGHRYWSCILRGEIC